jgi:hypothetical protein
MLLAFVLVACGPPARHHGNGGDDDGSDASNGDAEGECPKGTELIYTIDQFNQRLSQFDPMTKAFHDLGSLSCPALSGATPFSMSVDRSGFAWVLYTSGELFKVSVLNLASCTKTTWAGSSGLRVFGMGFATDVAGGSEETLYIGGGASQMQSSYTLAKIDLATMMVKTIGTQTQLPEMTGTGNAELWGFMPEGGNSRVVKLDKSNGSALVTYMVPALNTTGAGYAFAHWGGDFWAFLQKSGESMTTVHQIDGMTGAIKSSTPAPGRTIVGAGVSTCAPTVIL